MKKKNVLMMAMSLVLVAVIAVGGTLAYLTSNSGTLTNTFTVGNGYDDDPDNPALVLDETAKKVGSVNPSVIATTIEDRTETGNTDDTKYDPLAPGSKIAKDPTLYLKNGSPDSYVFAKVTGVDALVATNGIIVSTKAALDVNDNDTSELNTTYWTKVEDLGTAGDAGLDGYYVYTGNYEYSVVTRDGYKSLEPLFQSVVVKSNLKNMDVITAANDADIVVKGIAMQKDNLDSYTAAWSALKGQESNNEFFK